jgi:hypothetical protein
LKDIIVGVLSLKLKVNYLVARKEVAALINEEEEAVKLVEIANHKLSR